jgi:hypothetical protein
MIGEFPGSGQWGHIRVYESEEKPVMGEILTSESHDRACFRAGDPPTLALALDDACGDPESSRSRSSHAYAGRIGGMSPDEGGGRGWVECGAYRIGSESYVDNLRGYAETASGPPSVHAHPGKGQCALCGRWF